MTCVKVYWLPPDSSDKLQLSITVLLSFSVLLFVVSDSIPPSSDHTPVLSKCQIPLHRPDPTRQSPRTCRRPGLRRASQTLGGRVRLVEFGLKHTTPVQHYSLVVKSIWSEINYAVVLYNVVELRNKIRFYLSAVSPTELRRGFQFLGPSPIFATGKMWNFTVPPEWSMFSFRTSISKSHQRRSAVLWMTSLAFLH